MGSIPGLCTGLFGGGMKGVGDTLGDNISDTLGESSRS